MGIHFIILKSDFSLEMFQNKYFALIDQHKLFYAETIIL